MPNRETALMLPIGSYGKRLPRLILERLESVTVPVTVLWYDRRPSQTRG